MIEGAHRFPYQFIKNLQQAIRKPNRRKSSVKDLLVLAPQNDPFYAGKGGIMKDEAPRLAIKLNNCASNDPCELCGFRTDPEVGPELFLEGTWALVCYECGNKHAPALVDLLFYTRHAKYERAMKREQAGSHEDPWATGYDDPLYVSPVQVIEDLAPVTQLRPDTDDGGYWDGDYPEIYPLPWVHPF
jgi:hypothetical protein